MTATLTVTTVTPDARRKAALRSAEDVLLAAFPAPAVFDALRKLNEADDLRRAVEKERLRIAGEALARTAREIAEAEAAR